MDIRTLLSIEVFSKSNVYLFLKYINSRPQKDRYGAAGADFKNLTKDHHSFCVVSSLNELRKP